MGFWNDSDIAALLQGVGGVSVVHGSETGYGALDTPDQHQLPGVSTQQIGAHRILTVQTSAFPTVKVGITLTAGGNNYIVTDRQAQGDGALTQLLLKPA